MKGDALCYVFRSQGIVVRYLTPTCKMARGHHLHDDKIHGIVLDLIVVGPSCSICNPIGRSLDPAVSNNQMCMQTEVSGGDRTIVV
jgi:hypothetical protein